MKNIMNTLLKALLALILVIGIGKIGFAQEDNANPAPKTVIFRFQGRTVVEDWVKLVKKLMEQDFALEYLEIPVTSTNFKLTEQSLDELRNKNIPDDILESLEALKNQGFLGESNLLHAVEQQITAEQTVRYKKLILTHAVKSPNDNLCNIYKNTLNLPGCPAELKDLNPEIKDPTKDVHPEDKIRVPNLPLKEFEWILTADDPADLNDKNFEVRWEDYIKEKQEVGSNKFFIMRGWQLELALDPSKELNFEITPVTLQSLNLEKVPDDVLRPLESLIGEQFKGKKAFLDAVDKTANSSQPYHEQILKHATLPPILDTWKDLNIKNADVILPFKAIDAPLYSIHEAVNNFYNDCLKLKQDFTGDTVSYSTLLGVEELPSPPKKCTGNNCPMIILIDQPVYAHPDFNDAIESGGSQWDENLITSSDTSCPETKVTFEEDKRYHGTHLAGIMVSRKHFIGLARDATLRAFNIKNLVQATETDPNNGIPGVLSKSRRWNSFTPVFVFASEFSYREYQHNEDVMTPEGALLNPKVRLKYPLSAELLASPFLHKSIWVVSVGNSKKPETMLTKTTPKSPMNLGDQPHIIVVTACEECHDKSNAKIWDRAYYSYANKGEGLVHVAAPGGEEIPGIATDRHYTKAQGTSQAAAYVGGVVAEMIAHYPDIYDTLGLVKERIQVTARPFSEAKDMEKVTGGIVDLEKAFYDPAMDWLEQDEHTLPPNEVNPRKGKFSWNSDIGVITLRYRNDEHSLFDDESFPVSNILRIKKLKKPQFNGQQSQWIIFAKPDATTLGKVMRLGPGTIREENRNIGTFIPDGSSETTIKLTEIDDLLIRVTE